MVKSQDSKHRGTGIGDEGEERIETKHGFRTTPARSKMMKKIKSSGSKAEVRLAKALWARGYRYRKNVRKLPGKPDLVFPRYKVVVFVDGGFWHGHEWHHRKQKLLANLQDDHRKEYWIRKIERNMERDQQNNMRLMEAGWTVLRFWDHEVKKDLEQCVARVVGVLETRRVDKG